MGQNDSKIDLYKPFRCQLILKLRETRLQILHIFVVCRAAIKVSKLTPCQKMTSQKNQSNKQVMEKSTFQILHSNLPAIPAANDASPGFRALEISNIHTWLHAKETQLETELNRSNWALLTLTLFTGNAT